MAEEQTTASAEQTQAPDQLDPEQNIGVIYDKEKDQVRAFTTQRNEDGSYQTIDFTPENEHAFLIFAGNVPATFYQNFMRNYKEPKFDLFAFPKRMISKIRDAFSSYQHNTSADSVRLLYNYKVDDNGQFVCKLKSYGFREDQFPWPQLNILGLDRAELDRTGNLRRLAAGDITPLLSVESSDPLLRFRGDVKIRLEARDGKLRLDMRGPTMRQQKGIYNVKFSDEDRQQLATYGNLGHPIETPRGKALITQDFDTGQLYDQPQEWVHIPKKIFDTEITKEMEEAFKEGKTVPITIKDANGQQKTVNYQYNAAYRRVMPQMTREERNALIQRNRRKETQGNKAHTLFTTERPAPRKSKAKSTADESTPRPTVKNAQSSRRAKGQHH